MPSLPQPDLPRFVLHSGEYRVSATPVVMSTLLGSCVSVCLYDPRARLMGMNHFLLARETNRSRLGSEAPAAARYGVHAMTLLMDGLLALGASQKDLQAKAFGGASVVGRPARECNALPSVGEMNTRFVREYLDQVGIPLIAEDLGGNQGRQIHFNGDDFSVCLRRLGSRPLPS
jgi:chemotaxis protein CheD